MKKGDGYVIAAMVTITPWNYLLVLKSEVFCQMKLKKTETPWYSRSSMIKIPHVKKPQTTCKNLNFTTFHRIWCCLHTIEMVSSVTFDKLINNPLIKKAINQLYDYKLNIISVPLVLASAFSPLFKVLLTFKIFLSLIIYLHAVNIRSLNLQYTFH